MKRIGSPKMANVHKETNLHKVAEFHICADKTGLFSKPADLSGKLADEAITARGRYVALSCGSTPRGVRACLASDTYRNEFAWGNVHCFWDDEPCVLPAHGDSKYRMAAETFL